MPSTMRFFTRPLQLAGWTYLLPSCLNSHNRLGWKRKIVFSVSFLGSSSNNNDFDPWGSSSMRSNGDSTKNFTNNDIDWIESYLSKTSQTPSNGPVDTPRRFSSLSKLDLYDAADLVNVLQVHTEISQRLTERQNQPQQGEDLTRSITSLHETVLKTLNNHDYLNLGETVTSSSHRGLFLDEKFKSTLSQIRAIASDVDGTILTSRQTVHPRTRRAILEAVQRCQQHKTHKDEMLQRYFFLATGKSQKGALNSLGTELSSQLRNLPGVFLQGLYCVDEQSHVVFEQKLSPTAVEAAERLAEQWNVSVIAYDGNNLFTTKMTPFVMEITTKYGEPQAQLLNTLSDYSSGFHKILLMDTNVTKINTFLRKELEDLREEFGATVTQAIPTMLEWLPAGCSKGLGVRKLCEALGIDAQTQLLAIGDAENDSEMLKMAAIGVAVGNASPLAKDAADFVLEETNDQGGAGVAMELFAFGRALSDN